MTLTLHIRARQLSDRQEWQPADTYSHMRWSYCVNVWDCVLRMNCLVCFERCVHFNEPSEEAKDQEQYFNGSCNTPVDKRANRDVDSDPAISPFACSVDFDVVHELDESVHLQGDDKGEEKRSINYHAHAGWHLEE